MELNEGRVYTIKEAAEILNVHPGTVERYIREGQLTAAKLGGRTVRIQGRDIQAFLDSGK